MNIPENLSVTQLMELRALIKGSLTPAQIRAETIRNAASKRYYQRKRKEKMEAALTNQIAEAEEKLKDLKNKFSQL